MPPSFRNKLPGFLAFRFGVVYLTLFGLATQLSGSLLPNPWFAYRGLGRLWPMRELTHWVGRSIFGIDVPLDDVNGGETLFFWIQWFWILAASAAIAVAWTLVARRRTYDSWVPALRLVIRLVLAASLIEYGMTKVFLTQFPAPPLTALVTPVGEMTLSALLWTTIGSAPAYQIATGLVETLAGVLLLMPWTVTLGALLGLISLVQVLLLNLTFDIGVKLVTAHLVVMALILLAPAARQFLMGAGSRGEGSPAAGKWVGSRGTESPAADPTIAFSSRRAAAAQITFCIWLLGVQTWINWSFWEVAGGGRPKSDFYGIWNVETLSVNGETRPAELNDYDRRWRRVIFDDPTQFVVQRTDDSFARYGASIDRSQGTMTLTKGGSRNWSSRFTLDRPSANRLTLAGEMDGQQIEAQLQLVDRTAFPLLNSSFRWVRPHDP